MRLNKNICVFIACRAVSVISDQLLLFAIPLLIFHTTKSIALTGVTFFVEWLPRLISLPIAGVLADRWGGKKMYVVSDSIRSLACFSAYGAIAFFHCVPAIPVMALVPIAAFFYAQAFIGLESTLPRIASGRELIKAQSVLQSVEQAGAIFGPLLAGMCIHWLPVYHLLGVAGLIFSISGLAAQCCLPGCILKNKGQPQQSSIKCSSLFQGIKTVVETPQLVRLVFLTLLLNLVWGLVLATNVIWVTGIYHRSASVFAELQMGTGIWSVIVFSVLSRCVHRLNVVYLGMSAFLCVMLSGLLIGVTHYFMLYVLSYVLVISCDGLFNVYIRGERAKYIAKEDLGKVTGVIVLLNQLSLPISGLLVAYFNVGQNLSNLFFFASLGGILGIVLFQSVGFWGGLCAKT